MKTTTKSNVKVRKPSMAKNQGRKKNAVKGIGTTNIRVSYINPNTKEREEMVLNVTLKVKELNNVKSLVSVAKKNVAHDIRNGREYAMNRFGQSNLRFASYVSEVLSKEPIINLFNRNEILFTNSATVTSAELPNGCVWEAWCNMDGEVIIKEKKVNKEKNIITDNEEIILD